MTPTIDDSISAEPFARCGADIDAQAEVRERIVPRGFISIAHYSVRLINATSHCDDPNRRATASRWQRQ